MELKVHLCNFMHKVKENQQKNVFVQFTNLNFLFLQKSYFLHLVAFMYILNFCKGDIQILLLYLILKEILCKRKRMGVFIFQKY